MRISDSSPTSFVDATGSVILTSSNVLASDTNARAPGAMADAADWYQQFPRSGAGTSWEPLGPFPQEAVVLFSDRELTVAYPDVPGSSPSDLRVWGRWPLVLQPSVREGTDPDPGVVLPWITEVVDTATSGLFPVPTDLFPEVRIDSGAVWVLAAGALTCLDFCTDVATSYQQSRGRIYAGGLWPPDSIPDQPWGPDDPDLALGIGSFRSIDTWSDREASYAVVVGSTGAALLRKDFGFGGSPHSVVEIWEPEEFEPYDVLFGANGSIFVSGTTAAGHPALLVRAPITGPGGWGSPRVLIRGLDVFGPKLTRSSRNLWFYGGRGHVFRFESTPEELLSDTDVRYIAGPRQILDGVRTAEPDYRTVDTGSMLTGLAFNRELPVTLVALSAEQGGGTMLTVMGLDFRVALYRRYYLGLQTRILRSDLVTPGSVLLEPGLSADPVIGYGPDELETT